MNLKLKNKSPKNRIEKNEEHKNQECSRKIIRTKIFCVPITSSTRNCHSIEKMFPKQIKGKKFMMAIIQECLEDHPHEQLN